MNTSGPSTNLDLVRSVAISAVLFDHVSRQLGHPWFGGVGRAGVLMFFVHTALVLMFSLERLKSRGPSVTIPFYIQRAFRIFPLCWFAIALVLIFHVAPALGPSEFHWEGWRWVIANVLLIQNVTFSSFIIGPLWSLPYEVQMYLVLPAVHVIARRKKAVRWLIAISIFSIAFTIALNRVYVAKYGFHYDDNMLHSPLTYFVPCFLSGVLAFTLSRTHHLNLSPLVLPAFLLIFIYFVYRPPIWHTDYLACMALGALLPQVSEFQFEALRIIAFNIAQYSYGLYLFHAPLLWIVFTRFALSGTAGWPLFIGLAAGVSYLSYWSVEKPMMRNGQKLARRMVQESQPVAA